MVEYVGNLRIGPVPEALINGDPDVRRWFEALLKIFSPEGGIDLSQVNIQQSNHDTLRGVKRVSGATGVPLHVDQETITALHGVDLGLQNDLAAVAAEVIAVKGDLANTDARLTAAVADIASLNTSLAALSVRIANVEALAAAHETEITDVKARLTAGGL